MMFTTADHNNYMTGAGRDYGVFAFFTASDLKFGCHSCKYVTFGNSFPTPSRDLVRDGVKY